MPLLSIHYHPWINEYQCRVSSVPAICAPMTLTELLAASLFADANLLFQRLTIVALHLPPTTLRRQLGLQRCQVIRGMLLRAHSPDAFHHRQQG